MAAKPAPYDFQIEARADAKFQAEKDRYHLYVAYSCPFACRTLAARNLLGLQDIVSVSVAHPVYQKSKPDDDDDTHIGWAFVDPTTSSTTVGFNGKTYSTKDCTPDTVNHCKFLRDVYEKADPAPRYFSMPLLWDKKTHTVVSEQSTGILHTFDSAFRELVPSNVHLYPEELRAEIDAANENVAEPIQIGLFNTVFAKSPEEAEQLTVENFERVNKLNDLLTKKRFILGNSITETDVRLFNALIRIDALQKKSDKRHLTEFPSVVGYLRDLYQIPAIKAIVNWDHIKLVTVNRAPYHVAEGPFVDYEAGHDRAQRA